MMQGVDVLGRAINASLDDLLAALDLRPCGEGCFAVEPARFGRSDRVFGGQLLAQAVVGASATVSGKDIHSLHATVSLFSEPHEIRGTSVCSPDHEQAQKPWRGFYRSLLSTKRV